MLNFFFFLYILPKQPCWITLIRFYWNAPTSRGFNWHKNALARPACPCFTYSWQIKSPCSFTSWPKHEVVPISRSCWVKMLSKPYSIVCEANSFSKTQDVATSRRWVCNDTHHRPQYVKEIYGVTASTQDFRDHILTVMSIQISHHFVLISLPLHQ